MQVNEIIEGFKNLKVLVIGDAILDTYVDGAPERVSREAPVMVFNVNHQKYQCGGAANTAINIATLGAECFFVTVIGKDANGREMIDVLKRHRVHTDYILKDRSRTTIAKKRLVAASHQLMRIDEGTTTAISAMCEDGIIKAVENLSKTVNAIIVSDYCLGIFSAELLKKIGEIAAASNMLLIGDSKDLRRLSTLKPFVVKPNYEETVALLHIEKKGLNRAAQVTQYEELLYEVTGAERVAVTLDTEGVVYFEKGKSSYHIKALPQDNANAIGAGDTFISALTLALCQQVPGCIAADIAAAAAQLVIQQEGTAGCINSMLKSYFTLIPKLVASRNDLKELVHTLRKQGKKITFTNGCFDIIHKGHLYLLNAARQQGDVLIVGVNSDESIRKLKGPTRPINNLDDRLTVLSGFGSVDYLVSFTEESPVQLIKDIHPDIYVKGGTYTEQTLPEAVLLKKMGCDLHLVPYLQEQSTTSIINKIQHIEPAVKAAEVA